jgi:hypothetical protein
MGSAARRWPCAHLALGLDVGSPLQQAVCFSHLIVEYTELQRSMSLRAGGGQCLDKLSAARAGLAARRGSHAGGRVTGWERTEADVRWRWSGVIEAAARL